MIEDELEKDLSELDTESFSPRERILLDHLRLMRFELDEMKLDMVFSKADRNWEKGPADYMELAVAGEYGLDHRAFYHPLPKGKGRKKDNSILEARYMLYTMLHSVIGCTVNQIKANYHNDAWNYVTRWRPIFDLVHAPRPQAPGEKQQEYDRYFPRFKGIYARVKKSMVADGKWQEVFMVDLLEETE